MPDVHLLFYNQFIVIDHLLQKVSIVAIDLFQEGKTREEMDEYIHQIEEQLKNGTTLIEVEKSTVEFRPSIDQETFVNMVEKAKNYIECGDIFQVVLSQRFSSDFKGNPFSLYRRLRTSNPSPYMFYLEFDDYTILGTSPESLVKSPMDSLRRIRLLERNLVEKQRKKIEN